MELKRDWWIIKDILIELSKKEFATEVIPIELLAKYEQKDIAINIRFCCDEGFIKVRASSEMIAVASAGEDLLLMLKYLDKNDLIVNGDITNYTYLAIKQTYLNHLQERLIAWRIR